MKHGGMFRGKFVSHEGKRSQTRSGQREQANGHLAAIQNLDQIRQASKLLGIAVMNKSNDELGKIVDLVINRMGKATYVVVASGEGSAEKFFLVPWESIRPQMDQKMVTLDLSKEKFQAAPSMTKKTYHEARPREWLDGVASYFGVKRQAEGSESRESAEALKNAPRDVYLTDIIQQPIHDKNREVLANARELLLDENGRIVFAILQESGVVKIGQNGLAVPFVALKTKKGDQEKAYLWIDLNVQDMQNAPKLAKKDFADLLDRKVVSSTHRFYGIGERREIEAETPQREKAPQEDNQEREQKKQDN